MRMNLPLGLNIPKPAPLMKFRAVTIYSTESLYPQGPLGVARNATTPLKKLIKTRETRTNQCCDALRTKLIIIHPMKREFSGISHPSSRDYNKQTFLFHQPEREKKNGNILQKDVAASQPQTGSQTLLDLLQNIVDRGSQRPQDPQHHESAQENEQDDGQEDRDDSFQPAKSMNRLDRRYLQIEPE